MINYAYWLSNIPGIGIRTRNRLIGAAGSAREVYGLTEKQLLLIPGVEEKHAAGIMAVSYTHLDVYKRQTSDGTADGV